MSATKQSKYNWDVHFPRLVALYLQGLSFPEIHKAVKTSDFCPSEKTVYNKLTQEGYPADKIKREAVCRQLNIAQWPSEIVSSSNTQRIRRAMRPALISNAADDSTNAPFTIGSNSMEELTEPPFGENPDFPPHASVASASNAAPESHGQTPVHNSYDVGLCEQSEWAVGQDYSYGQFFDEDMTLFGKDFPDGLAVPSQEARLGMGDEACNVSPRAGLSHAHDSHHGPELNQEGGDVLQFRDLRQTSGAKLFGYQQNMATPIDVPDLDVMDTPSPFSTITFPATPGAGYSKTRPLDRLNSRFGAFKSTNSDRNSSSTFDSGYGSGRSSPFSFQAVERPSRRTVPAQVPPPTPPFNGLHRVPCKGFHEPRKYNPFYKPQPTDRYREVDTCRKCRYSAIHNLSWSAQYLKFEVFETELKLPETYELTALDAAGNSALHYAAIGGADMEVIATLMRSGVDPYRINTSGELFLHCLRPHFDQSTHDFEKCMFPIFRTNLVNLLNVLDPKTNGFFRWRDNSGKTALERFVSSISDNDLRSRIEETVTSAGYPLPTLDKSKNEPLSSRMYTFLDTTVNTDFNKARQRIAKEIKGHASKDPTFVHPETGDNFLHALARLRPQESAELISQIRRLIAKDVDLNLRNFDQEGPLTAFTQEPVNGLTSEETGATISKYLDAILWNDPQKRIPNKINVNMRNREGATPLYYAAIRARPDSVRSLIEAGANVNARLEINGQRTSILLASEKERDKIDPDKDPVRFDRMNNVISYLEHANAVLDPTEFEERCVCENTVGSIAL